MTTNAATSGREMRDGYRRVSVNGVDLAYVEEGHGEAVVFVHGGISDLTIWERQVPAFAEHYRAIAYSRRFAWPNTPIMPDADDQLAPHVDDLVALLQALGTGPAHLVGNSWGAFICLLAAQRAPALVRTLTLEEPPVLPLLMPVPPDPQDVLKMLVAHPRAGSAVMRFMLNGMLPAMRAFRRDDLEGGMRLFATAVLGADVYEALPAEVKTHMLVNADQLRAQFLGAGFPRFRPADARAIRQPALIVGGAKSPAWLHCLNDRLASLLPDVQRLEIANAAHVMHFEQPATLNHGVLSFLARH